MINKFVKFAQHHALKNSKKIILLAISITIFIGSGIRFILLDDNVMNMLPNNIESKRVWEDIVQELCKESNTQAANVNSPGQIVISGLKSDIDIARPEVKGSASKLFIKPFIKHYFFR